MEQDKQINKYYNDLAATYDSERFGNSYGLYIHKQEIRILNKFLSNEKNKLALDLGCGTGRFLRFGHYGIDSSNAMIDKARQKFPEKLLFAGDAENTMFENNFFDQIYCMHVFMHLSKEKTINIFAEVLRIMKPGGIFIIDFPSRKRRKLFNRTGLSWHGTNEYNIEEISILTEPNWKIKAYRGILFFPIHRVPEILRKPLLAIDNWFCRSFLKNYASYLMVVLKKNEN